MGDLTEFSKLIKPRFDGTYFHLKPTSKIPFGWAFHSEAWGGWQQTVILSLALDGHAWAPKGEIIGQCQREVLAQLEAHEEKDALLIASQEGVASKQKGRL